MYKKPKDTFNNINRIHKDAINKLQKLAIIKKASAEAASSESQPYFEVVKVEPAPEAVCEPKENTEKLVDVKAEVLADNKLNPVAYLAQSLDFIDRECLIATMNEKTLVLRFNGSCIEKFTDCVWEDASAEIYGSVLRKDMKLFRVSWFDNNTGEPVARPQTTSNCSKRLKDTMELRGLNAYGLSRATGVPAPTINNILSGRTLEPRATTLKKIAKGLGVTSRWLKGGNK